MRQRQATSKAFTLIEMLVVLLVIALLMSILAPALTKARRCARALVSRHNQKQLVTGTLVYSADARGRFPDSVATLGTGTRWSWREPTVLIGFQKRSPLLSRSVSQYLREYIESASTLFCPSSPTLYPYMKQAWLAGDAWDNPDPETAFEDPLFGTYCLYWNYIGYLEDKAAPFIGPHTNARRKGESTLLISDYFGYGHWRNELTYGSRYAWGSCEKLPSANISAGTAVAADFWSLYSPTGELSGGVKDVRLNAGYVDGHVGSYTPQETLMMKISMKPDGTVPYPDAVSPGGLFYIPQNSW
jgi:prepilin-type N-terminal cleavage/methylation domain-containing protein/prepilin-type processing-associated H-X9-DG protein